MLINNLPSRKTKKNEYKPFELIGPTGKVIIELYTTPEGEVQVGNVEIFDGRGMTNYKNSKFGVKDFKAFLDNKIGEIFPDKDRISFFKRIYHSASKNNSASANRAFEPKRIEIPKSKLSITTPIQPLTNPNKFEVISNTDEHIEVNFPVGSTDAYTYVKIRKEQPLLRKMLLNDSENHHCAICDNYIPNSFLIAAHIKKRSKASEDERKNPSIVVPMCKLGCDSLFEDGWIGIQGKKVIRIRTDVTTPHLNNIIRALIGKESRYINEVTLKFFEWHRNFHANRFS